MQRIYLSLKSLLRYISLYLLMRLYLCSLYFSKFIRSVCFWLIILYIWGLMCLKMLMFWNKIFEWILVDDLYRCQKIYIKTNSFAFGYFKQTVNRNNVQVLLWNGNLFLTFCSFHIVIICNNRALNDEWLKKVSPHHGQTDLNKKSSTKKSTFQTSK